MTSNINGTIPTAGSPITAEPIRTNFATAKDEITTLQAQMAQRGVPAGGTTNQVLAKRSATDYDLVWDDVSGGLPYTAENVANKVTSFSAPDNTKYPSALLVWNTINQFGVPSGGATNQVLAKNSATDRDLKWVTAGAGTVTSVGGTGTVQGLTLSGSVTSSGNLTLGGTFVQPNLTGEVTSTGVATVVTNAAVIAKLLTGFTGVAGVVAATDSILSAINKIVGNLAAWRVPAGGAIGQVLSKTSAADNTLSWVGGAWVAYTPTLSNMTIGNGTVAGRYCIIGKTVNVTINIVFGSTTTMSSNATATLPFTGQASNTANTCIGSVTLWDATATLPYAASAGFNAALNSANIRIAGGISATAPFTWGAGDAISYNLTYEVA